MKTMFDKTLFGSRLRKVMKEKGVTQEALAGVSGVCRYTVVNYLHGRVTPRFEVLYDIAEALGVSIDYLSGRKEDPNV